MELAGRLRALSGEQGRRAIVVALAAGLVFLTGWTLAQLVWLVVEGPVAAGTPVAVVAVAVQPRHTPDDAADWALFGDAAATPVAGAGESVAETDLPLQLLGLFSMSNQAQAGAVIAQRGGEGELYRVGASLPGGATLERVEKDHVLLRRRGQLETLRFDAITGPAAAATTTGLDMAGGFRRLRDRVTGADDDGEAPRRTGFAALAEQLRDDPDGMLNKYGLKPAAGGTGYQVADGEQAQSMRNLGLRPGDVVLSVNGSPLGDPDADAQLVEQVQESGEARLEIRRGSQTFTVNYPL